ncbi:MAG: ATP-binding protein [Gammaproteobacteria bacterium]|jgi:signal transduction histidine kinase
MSALSIIQERWNNELEQALVRLLVGIFVGLFILFQITESNIVDYAIALLYALGAYLAISVVLIVLIIRTQSPSFFRRLAGIFADMSGLSVAMYTMSEAGAVIFSFYLWVIMGNGLRFGKLYLFIAMVCAIVGFGVVAVTNAFWSQHPPLSIGILIGFVALPLYFSKLLTRLTNVNATLESRVSERTSELEVARDHALAANKAKTQFLANMSHELRTPLNAIIGYSEMLEEGALEERRSNDLADLKKINYAGKHLLEMINDILDLSKIESGEMSLKREPVNIQTLLQNIIETIHPMLKQNNNAIVVKIDSDLSTINVDKLRLRQVLLNLVSNANKFTNNGTIELQAMMCNAGNKQYVEISVRDTGIGISEKDMIAIFNPFTQVDNTYTRQYAGSGLGLAISQNLCRMMGGDLSVESVLGKGSVFTVSLPKV